MTRSHMVVFSLMMLKLYQIMGFCQGERVDDWSLLCFAQIKSGRSEAESVEAYFYQCTNLAMKQFK